jgi:MFS family permease
MTPTAGSWTTMTAAQIGRGRWAVTAVFFLNGLTLASYLIRLPSIKAAHHLSDGQIGAVGTLFAVTALVTMQFIGALVSRLGSRRIIRVTLAAMPIVLIGVGLAPSTATFAVTVAVLGAVHGTLDVSMNAHAVAVERLRGRPLMSGCHAAWSISAVLASVIGGVLIHAGVGTGPHFVGVGIVVVASGLVTCSLLLPADADRDAIGVDTNSAEPVGARRDSSTGRTSWTRPLILLGLTGMVLMICEGAALAWSGIFLHESRGASLTVASLGVTAYTAAQTSGRLFGDRLKTRYGDNQVFRAAGLLGVAGFVVAVASADPAWSVAGFAIFGLGGSVLLPLTYSAVGHAGGTGPGAARFVSRFSTFTYSGILVGPSLIGWIAEAIGLVATFAALIPLLALVALATRLPRAVDAAEAFETADSVVGPSIGEPPAPAIPSTEARAVPCP